MEVLGLLNEPGSEERLVKHLALARYTRSKKKNYQNGYLSLGVFEVAQHSP
jgi:hypothetical protein